MNRQRIRVASLVSISIFVLASGSSRVSSDDKSDAVIDFDGLKSTAPASWKSEAPASKMRYRQFRMPKIGEDKSDAEMLIFRGLGGSAKENIARWKGQFQPPTGKKLDDVAKVTEFKVAGSEVSYLDVTGTYEFKIRPFDPNEKAEKRTDYRMLAVHFDGPKNVYHIKLVGPAKTIEHYKKGFDEWVKAFK